MLHLYHGNGKGKTTAAMGLTLRMLGAGLPICVVQFLKDGSSGEARMIGGLPHATLLHDAPPVRFTFAMSEDERAASRREHDANLREALCWLEGHRAAGQGCLLVLDEALDALGAGLLDEGLVREVVGRCAGVCGPADPEAVLTGRDPAPYLLEAADYVTEMRCVRHPYERGVGAREGVEY